MKIEIRNRTVILWTRDGVAGQILGRLKPPTRGNVRSVDPVLANANEALVLLNAGPLQEEPGNFLALPARRRGNVLRSHFVGMLEKLGAITS